MMERECVGYKIVTAVSIDAEHELVIGRHPTAPAKFVCWDCRAGDDYHNGGYCQTYRQALLVLAERIKNRYNYLPIDLLPTYKEEDA